MKNLYIILSFSVISSFRYIVITLYRNFVNSICWKTRFNEKSR